MASEQANECATNAGEKFRFSSDTSSQRYPTGFGRSVLINTLALYPPLGWMVETKDSAALFLPSTEALSHGRSARRIGRVHSHKRSLRNQFHLFVNTREDFHSPGGIPPQDHVVVPRPRSISLLLDGNSVLHCRSPKSSAPPRITNTVRIRGPTLSISSRFSSLFYLKTIVMSSSSHVKRTEASEKVSRKRVKPRAANWLVTLTGNPSASSLIVLAFDEANTSSYHRSVVRKDIISFSALWTLCFADYSRLHRFTLGDSFPEERPVLQPFAL